MNQASEASMEYEFYVIEADDGHASSAAEEHEEAHSHDGGTLLGFWIYLMSDCLIFAVLFAVYAVLGQNFAAGPGPRDLFEIHMILLATFMLLFSSITFGFAVLRMQMNDRFGLNLWLTITGLFGLAFLYLEYLEFRHLWDLGATPMASAFLSSFYLLVGTHGLHVMAGCIWLVVLMVQIGMYGINEDNRRRVMCLSLFWHFLDLIWIGVYSLVYLTGAVT